MSERSSSKYPVWSLLILGVFATAGFITVATIMFRLGEESRQAKLNGQFLRAIQDFSELEAKIENEIGWLEQEVQEAARKSDRDPRLTKEALTSRFEPRPWALFEDATDGALGESQSGSDLAVSGSEPAVSSWRLIRADETWKLVVRLPIDPEEPATSLTAARRLSELDSRLGSLAGVYTLKGLKVWQSAEVEIPQEHLGPFGRGLANSTSDGSIYWLNVTLGDYRLLFRHDLKAVESGDQTAEIF